MSDDEAAVLPFTGERFTPECLREIAYEHWHRYSFVARLCQGKRVLDVACGEGYGSAFLARVADHVVGVDADPAAIAHARTRYASTAAKLSLECWSATDMPGLEDSSVDVVVCFETLEHIHAHDAALTEFKRVLKDDGLLVISTPDKRNYSEINDIRNEFHVKELYRHEFEDLLGRHFPRHELFAQRVLTGSAIWDIARRHDAPKQGWEAFTSQGQSTAADVECPPYYYIAVCRKAEGALPIMPQWSWYSDAEQSAFQSYASIYRDALKLQQRVQELQRELDELRRGASGGEAV